MLSYVFEVTTRKQYMHIINYLFLKFINSMLIMTHFNYLFFINTNYFGFPTGFMT